MEEIFEGIKFFVSISIVLILIKSYLNKKKGIKEVLTYAGKVVFILNGCLVIIYTITRSIISNSFDINTLKYFVEGTYLFLLFYSIIFYLNHFGILKNWLSIEKNKK